MANSLPAPWLLPVTSHLIKENFDKHMLENLLCRPRAVQVVSAYDNINCIVINDKKHKIAVALSPDCINRFRESHHEQSIVSLQNSIIKLEKWHFSTVVQCYGNHYGAVAKILTFPLIVNCSQMSSLGAYDCCVIGSPSDINSDASVRKLLSEMTYGTLVERLSHRQFPNERQLPSANGLFSIPEPFSDRNPLLIDHCLIPPKQCEMLQLTPHPCAHLMIGESEQQILENNYYSQRYFDDDSQFSADMEIVEQTEVSDPKIMDAPSQVSDIVILHLHINLIELK
jgi:hypothetical protein